MRPLSHRRPRFAIPAAFGSRRWPVEQQPELDPEVVRQTRRFGWIDHALAPLAASVPAERLRVLRYALALVMGAEALIVMRDVCRLSPDAATEVMRWAAATLIRGVR